MSTFSITAGQTGISFAPSSTAAEVVQNVRTILATRKGSVPLDRDFGVSWDMLDKPLPVARALMISEVVEAVRTYEQRATVTGVSFDPTVDDLMEGVLRPTVTIDIDEDADVSKTSQSASAVTTSVSDEQMTTVAAVAAQAAAAAQEAAASVAAASALAAQLASIDVGKLDDRLKEFEVTDYSTIYDTGSDEA